MSPADFRRLALQMKGASEAAHMGHPDFRVNGKIFATLGYPDEYSGMVVLTPDDQATFIGTAPHIFAPAKGAWGRSGSTQVTLAAADVATVSKAITAAWQRRASKSLVKRNAASN